jgi:uncharacterized membrane protein
MLIGDPLDTLMNLVAFAFLGALGWLLWRDLPERPDSPDHGPGDGSRQD